MSKHLTTKNLTNIVKNIHFDKIYMMQDLASGYLHKIWPEPMVFNLKNTPFECSQLCSVLCNRYII